MYVFYSCGALLLRLVAAQDNELSCAIRSTAAMTVVHPGQTIGFTSEELQFDASIWPSFAIDNLGLMYVRGTRDEYNNEDFDTQTTCGAIIHQIGNWKGPQEIQETSDQFSTFLLRKTTENKSSATHAILSHVSGLGWRTGSTNSSIILLTNRGPEFGDGWDATTADCPSKQLPSAKQFIDSLRANKVRLIVASPNGAVRTMWVDKLKDLIYGQTELADKSEMFDAAQRLLEAISKDTVKHVDVFAEPELAQEYLPQLYNVAETKNIQFSLTLFDSFSENTNNATEQEACYWPVHANISNSKSIQQDKMSIRYQFWQGDIRDMTARQSPVGIALIRAAKFANWNPEQENRVIFLVTSDAYSSRADSASPTGSGGCSRMPADSEVISAIETANAKVIVWTPDSATAATWRTLSERMSSRMTIAYGKLEPNVVLPIALRKVLCDGDIGPWTVGEAEAGGVPTYVIGAAAGAGAFVLGTAMLFARRFQRDDDDGNEADPSDGDALIGTF